MHEYKRILKKLADADSQELINNSSTEHAIALISALFEKGRSQAVVVTGSLNPLIYGNESVARSVGAFLSSRDSSLRIVVANPRTRVPDEQILDNDEGLIAQLRRSVGSEALSRIEMFRAPETDTDHPELDIPFHFVVVDGTRFRLEPDKTKHEALASFNSPDIAGQLSTHFDALVKRCTKIFIITE